MFELNGVKYDFKRIDVESALEIQTLISAEGEAEKQAQKRLCEIAVSHLRLYLKEDKKEVVVEAPNLDYCADIFQNPFFTLEIVASFGEVVKGFLELLPSFKKSLAVKGKKQGISKS